MITLQKTCRICKNSDLIEITDLGEHSLSGRFPFKDEPTPIVAPLVLMKCNDSCGDHCGLVQLKHNVASDELYNHDYGYRSGLNDTMTRHLGDLTKCICQKIKGIQKDDIILDIGSNDCTLLKSYPYDGNFVRYIGIDPTGRQFAHFYPSYVDLVKDFFSHENFNRFFPNQKAKIITSIAMFYDLPDPLNFMKDIKNTLSHDGLWVFEQSYIISMLETVSFDTICHEHLEYYAFKQIEWMIKRVGLRVIDVSLNDCNGGSFRVTVTHEDNDYVVNQDAIDHLKSIEKMAQLDTMIPYKIFNEKTSHVKEQLTFLLNLYKNNGKRIYLYGASTKGNTLLQYFGIDRSLIMAAAERNVEKYGRRTPQTDIPIISELEMRLANPEVLLVLPWHFKNEFIMREKDYFDKGGVMLFPLPNMDLVSHRKRALIIGVSGQIGQYLSEKLINLGYDVYGLARNKGKLNSKIIFTEGDINDTHLLDIMIKSIMPHEIYNLASPTTISETINDPLSAYHTNIDSLTNICEIIKSMNHGIKLFNANSSEIFRGNISNDHLTFDFDEQCTNFSPVSPYGISKSTAYWIIRYYREQFGLPFYTGFLCNVVSPRLKDRYLFVKLIKHVKYHVNEILHVGNIDLEKDFSHASDVVDGIITLIHSENQASDYVIASGVSHSLIDVINHIYEEQNITITWHDKPCLNTNCHMYIGTDSVTGRLLIECDLNLCRNYEKSGEKIIGDSHKLMNLGWKPKYCLKQTIHEIYSVI